MLPLLIFLDLFPLPHPASYPLFVKQQHPANVEIIQKLLLLLLIFDLKVFHQLSN